MTDEALAHGALGSCTRGKVIPNFLFASFRLICCIATPVTNTLTVISHLGKVTGCGKNDRQGFFWGCDLLSALRLWEEPTHGSPVGSGERHEAVGLGDEDRGKKRDALLRCSSKKLCVS